MGHASEKFRFSSSARSSLAAMNLHNQTKCMYGTIPTSKLGNTYPLCNIHMGMMCWQGYATQVYILCLYFRHKYYSILIRNLFANNVLIATESHRKHLSNTLPAAQERLWVCEATFFVHNFTHEGMATSDHHEIVNFHMVCIMQRCYSKLGS